MIKGYFYWKINAKFSNKTCYRRLKNKNAETPYVKSKVENEATR
jgi:hypothetical protein